MDGLFKVSNKNSLNYFYTYLHLLTTSSNFEVRAPAQACLETLKRLESLLVPSPTTYEIGDIRSSFFLTVVSVFTIWSDGELRKFGIGTVTRLIGRHLKGVLKKDEAVKECLELAEIAWSTIDSAGNFNVNDIIASQLNLLKSASFEKGALNDYMLISEIEDAKKLIAHFYIPLFIESTLDAYRKVVAGRVDRHGIIHITDYIEGDIIADFASLPLLVKGKEGSTCSLELDAITGLSFVVGEPGSGRSFTLKRLAGRLRDERDFLVRPLDISDLIGASAQPSWESLLNRVGLGYLENCGAAPSRRFAAGPAEVARHLLQAFDVAMPVDDFDYLESGTRQSLVRAMLALQHDFPRLRILVAYANDSSGGEILTCEDFGINLGNQLKSDATEEDRAHYQAYVSSARIVICNLNDMQIQRMIDLYIDKIGRGGGKPVGSIKERLKGEAWRLQGLLNTAFFLSLTACIYYSTERLPRTKFEAIDAAFEFLIKKQSGTQSPAFSTIATKIIQLVAVCLLKARNRPKDATAFKALYKSELNRCVRDADVEPMSDAVFRFMVQSSWIIRTIGESYCFSSPSVLQHFAAKRIFAYATSDREFIGSISQLVDLGAADLTMYAAQVLHTNSRSIDQYVIAMLSQSVPISGSGRLPNPENLLKRLILLYAAAQILESLPLERGTIRLIVGEALNAFRPDVLDRHSVLTLSMLSSVLKPDHPNLDHVQEVFVASARLKIGRLSPDGALLYEFLAGLDMVETSMKTYLCAPEMRKAIDDEVVATVDFVAAKALTRHRPACIALYARRDSAVRQAIIGSAHGDRSLHLLGMLPTTPKLLTLPPRQGHRVAKVDDIHEVPSTDPEVVAMLTEIGLPVDLREAQEIRLFRVLSDGELVGFVGWRELTASLAMMHTLIVVPERREQGNGTAMLRWALAKLRDSGISDVYLVAKPAWTLPEGLGFRAVSNPDSAPMDIKRTREYSSIRGRAANILRHCRSG